MVNAAVVVGVVVVWPEPDELEGELEEPDELPPLDLVEPEPDELEDELEPEPELELPLPDGGGAGAESV